MEDYQGSRDCPDSDCGGTAEPEEELAEGGLLRWFRCEECELEFGHSLVADMVPSGSCSLGVPEPVRRAISLPQEARPVFLGSIGRRPE